MKNDTLTTDKPAAGLLSAKDLLIEIWPNKNSRPSMRWLRQCQADRTLPYVKCGRLVFFNPTEVMRVLVERCTVKESNRHQ